jgi:hypothetical protein
MADKRGGKRQGAGRPAGSRNIYSRDSVKKLEELGFDPIEMLVDKYKEIQKALTDGSVRTGSGAYAQLLATQAQIVNNLMRYGYRQVPEKIEQEITDKKPLAVKLTMKKSEK